MLEAEQPISAEISQLETDAQSTSPGAIENAVAMVMSALSQSARLEAILYLKGRPVSLSEAIEAARRHRRRHYRSRAKRCCKNSTEFEQVKLSRLQGYKRKGFDWKARDLETARDNGTPLKGHHVIGYRGVCMKRHARKRLHLNRCLASWKMSRALEVRGISVPRALAYYEFEGYRYYLAELLNDRLHLNAYLSALTDEQSKRRALKKLALCLRIFHD